MAIVKYGNLVWNYASEKTDLYLDADLLKAALDITEILANVGDFQGRANLRTLLASLGIPDVAAKPLYTLLVTDRLDHGTYGLSALQVLLAALQTTANSVETDTQKLYDAAFGVAPADGSLASFIATGGTALGTRLPASMSLYDVLLGNVNLVNRAAAKEQIKATTIDLAQAAASYTLFTGTIQDVQVESLLIRLPNVNVSDDATITSISIQTNDATPQVFVNSVVGAKAYLTAEAQLGWTGVHLLKAGKLIRLTIAGGAADAATTCDVIVKCRAVVSGGYLA